MGKKVVVAGHVCIDLTPMFPRGQKVKNPGDMLIPGKLINMDGIDIHTGGSVSNTGLAMKKLGADVTLLGKTGTDEIGMMIAKIFGEYDAAEGIMAVEGERTSYTIAIAVPGVDRIFLHDPGSNDTYSYKEIPEEKLEDVALLHLGYPPLMRNMYINEGQELLEMMQMLKGKGIATSVDMAMVDEASAAGQEDWKAIITKTLPYIDFFVPSIEELCWMLDRPRYREWEKRAAGQDMAMILDPEKDIKPLADMCMELGAKVLLLKCGAPGLYYKTAGEDKLQEIAQITGIDAADWADREGFEASYVPEKILSGTGAGDTTIAAFLTSMLEGYSFEMCIHLAAGEGASCVEAYDSLGGIRSLKELETKINAGWEKQKF